MFTRVSTSNATSRRDPQYFENKYNRLRIADHSLFYIGPRLYNNTANEINKGLPSNVPLLQNKFIDPFKANVSKYLLAKQTLNDDSASWLKDNFVLYNV